MSDTPAPKKKKSKKDVSGEQAVVLCSGNLGLIYLMEESRRLTLEEIEQRHPDLIPALRDHPHVGFLGFVFQLEATIEPRHVCARAAHVEPDRSLESGRPRHLRKSNDAARRPGKNAVLATKLFT